MEKIHTTSIAIFDLTQFPIVIITCTKEQPTAQDIIEYKSKKEEIFETFTTPFVVIGDISKVKWMDADARIAYGKNMKETADKYSNLMIKTYAVVPNIIANAILKGVNLIAKPKYEQVICKSFEQAYSKALHEKDLIENLKSA
ncbi:hypothetical protein MY04_4732 [Flammeovirga sp. MY04]|uniref:hypothetical protein n=1 Tax=Flammeovirga sp. MY04 TaxID=1191459 RepID=UPI0008061B06|nr:hypothetical protein [Flammeovirga sp. MY04]ANQ52067.1 hypothetical protein MY04_4732 [Flammeovirga sp. MY04]